MFAPPHRPLNARSFTRPSINSNRLLGLTTSFDDLCITVVAWRIVMVQTKLLFGSLISLMWFGMVCDRGSGDHVALQAPLAQRL